MGFKEGRAGPLKGSVRGTDTPPPPSEPIEGGGGGSFLLFQKKSVVFLGPKKKENPPAHPLEALRVGRGGGLRTPNLQPPAPPIRPIHRRKTKATAVTRRKAPSFTGGGGRGTAVGPGGAGGGDRRRTEPFLPQPVGRYQLFISSQKTGNVNLFYLSSIRLPRSSISLLSVFYAPSTPLLFLRSKCGSLLRASIISLKMRFLTIRNQPQTVPEQKNKKTFKTPTPTPATPYHPFPPKNTTPEFDFFNFCVIFKYRGSHIRLIAVS